MIRGITLGLVLITATSLASADLLHSIDVTGTESWDEKWNDNNIILIVDVATAVGLPAGTAVDLIGVGWDVTIQSESFSLLSEATVYLDEAIAPGEDGVTLSPGIADGFPGLGSYQHDVISVGPVTLPDGRLYLQFFEDNDQVSDAIDATWTEGTLTVEVTPEPASFALFALAVLLRRGR